MELDKILCPVDFSKCSELALDYALALAAQYDAEVAVMHVVPNVLADPDVYPYLNEPIVPSEEARERALKQLGSFVHRALERNISTDVVLEDGDVIETLVEKAGQLEADWIVMGTHGRRGVHRLLLGSATENVLRRATVPVLSVAPSSPGPRSEDAAFRNVLCPVDFSPSSLRGLDIAVRLTGEDTKLTVLHVVEFYMDASLGEAAAYDLDEIREKQRKQAEDRLVEIVPSELRARTKLETVVMSSGGPYKEILRVAERDENDLVVMGVAGRSAADMFFFGSTTNHVVRSAKCPVLTVHSEAG